ncbi:A24 family peptidase [Sedimentibacter sp.]|uniref:prepilin peptidase n=1 Tax=Sedimentibacter sp. TaxID=1960295 RepID=UPI0028ADA8EA|nr:A24 family peptidase [Sedimentibacter sp.]
MGEKLLSLIIICWLISISIIDIKHKIIPDSLNVTGLFIGITYIIINKQLLDSLIGAAIGFGLFLLIALITNAMGGGDIKLMLVLGLIFGIKGILFITLFSFLIGAVISVILLSLRIKSRKDEIPFAPFISLSVLIYIFFGNEIINWYFTLLMPF